MTRTQFAWVAEFLKQLGDRFGNDGCNDFDLPNTPANVCLLCEAIEWGCGSDATEMKNEVYAAAKQRESKNHIRTTNSILCGYLAHLAEQESK